MPIMFSNLVERKRYMGENPCPVCEKDPALLTFNTVLIKRENGCLSMSKGRRRLCLALISGGATSVTSDTCCRPDTGDNHKMSIHNI